MEIFFVLDIAVIDFYVIGIVFVGIYFVCRVGNTLDYFIAGRKLGAFPIAATVCATVVGGAAFIGQGDYIYTYGVAGAFLAVPYLLGLYVFSFVAGRIQAVGKNNNFTSIPDLLAFRFGREAQGLASVFIVFSTMATLASQIAAFAIIIISIFSVSIPYEAAACISLFIIISYASISGFFGVVYTDMVQSILFIAFVFILLPLRSVEMIGGITAIFANIPREMFSLSIPQGMTGMLLTNFLVVFAGAEMWQRAYAAKSPKVARRGILIGNSVYLFTIIITVILTLSAFLLLPDIVNTHGTALAVLPVLIIRLMPAGLMGFTVSALFAIIMSTADSYLFVSVQTLVLDLIKPRLKKEMSGKKQIFLSRVFSVVVGICALVIALYMKSVYAILMFAWTFYASAVAIPVMAALFWKKATAFGIISGMVSGVLACILWSVIGAPFLPVSFVSAIVCFLFTVFGSFFTYRNNPAPMPESDCPKSL